MFHSNHERCWICILTTVTDIVTDLIVLELFRPVFGHRNDHHKGYIMLLLAISPFFRRIVLIAVWNVMLSKVLNVALISFLNRSCVGWIKVQLRSQRDIYISERRSKMKRCYGVEHIIMILQWYRFRCKSLRTYVRQHVGT